MATEKSIAEQIEIAVAAERASNALLIKQLTDQHKAQSNISLSLQEERASVCEQLHKLGLLLVDGELKINNGVNEGRPIVTMKHMTMEDGSDGWYADHPEFYCDIEKTEEGDWSIFFKDKNGKEAYKEMTT